MFRHEKRMTAAFIAATKIRVMLVIMVDKGCFATDRASRIF
jgi:hypothetical protein